MPGERVQYRERLLENSYDPHEISIIFRRLIKLSYTSCKDSL